MGATGVYCGTETVRRCILSGTNIIGDPVNVLWRRSAMEKAGTFDPDILYCTDVEFWLRLLNLGDLFFDRKPVGYYRIHGKAAATQLESVVLDDFLRMVQKQNRLGNFKLNSIARFRIRLFSCLQNKLTQFLYQILG
jgi:GT2 family glycosyltransferase